MTHSRLSGDLPERDEWDPVASTEVQVATGGRAIGIVFCVPHLIFRMHIVCCDRSDVACFRIFYCALCQVEWSDVCVRSRIKIRLNSQSVRVAIGRKLRCATTLRLAREIRYESTHA